jgi:hypothetical protein
MMYRSIIVHDDIIHAHIVYDLVYIDKFLLIRTDLLYIPGIGIEIGHIFVPDQDCYSYEGESRSLGPTDERKIPQSHHKAMLPRSLDLLLCIQELNGTRHSLVSTLNIFERCPRA